MDKQFRKYYEARYFIKDHGLSEERKHRFARFFAESDWDDERAALREFL